MAHESDKNIEDHLAEMAQAADASKDGPPDPAQAHADALEQGGETHAERDGERESASAASVPRRAARRAGRGGATQTGGVKAFAAPILMTVGALLLVPAIWSVRYLSGVEGVSHAQREGARPMALLMLICWPMALALMAASVVCFVKVARDKKDSPTTPRRRRR